MAVFRRRVPEERDFNPWLRIHASGSGMSTVRLSLEGGRGIGEGAQARLRLEKTATSPGHHCEQRTPGVCLVFILVRRERKSTACGKTEMRCP